MFLFYYQFHLFSLLFYLIVNIFDKMFKPTHPKHNVYGKRLLWAQPIPQGYNELHLSSPYWNYGLMKPVYRQDQMRSRMRTPSTFSNVAKKYRTKYIKNYPRKEFRRDYWKYKQANPKRQIKNKGKWEKWKYAKYKPKKYYGKYTKEYPYKKRKFERKQKKNYSWYRKDKEVKFKERKEQNENIKKILNDLMTNQSETPKVEFTYNHKTHLFYNVQFNNFISKKELEKYNKKEHLQKVQQEGYRKANYHFLKKDTDLLIWNEQQNAWYSVREDEIIKISEMNYVKKKAPKKMYDYFNQTVAKKIEDRRKKRIEIEKEPITDGENATKQKETVDEIEKRIDEIIEQETQDWYEKLDGRLEGKINERINEKIKSLEDENKRMRNTLAKIEEEDKINKTKLETILTTLTNVLTQQSGILKKFQEQNIINETIIQDSRTEKESTAKMIQEMEEKINSTEKELQLYKDSSQQIVQDMIETNERLDRQDGAITNISIRQDINAYQINTIGTTCYKYIAQTENERSITNQIIREINSKGIICIQQQRELLYQCMINKNNCLLLRRYLNIGMEYMQKRMYENNLSYVGNTSCMMIEIDRRIKGGLINGFGELLMQMQRIICGDYNTTIYPQIAGEVKQLLEYTVKQDFPGYTIEDVPPSEQQTTPQTTSYQDTTQSGVSTQN